MDLITRARLPDFSTAISGVSISACSGSGPQHVTSVHKSTYECVCGCYAPQPHVRRRAVKARTGVAQGWRMEWRMGRPRGGPGVAQATEVVEESPACGNRLSGGQSTGGSLKSGTELGG